MTEPIKIALEVVSTAPAGYYVSFMRRHTYRQEELVEGIVIKEHPFVWVFRENKWSSDKLTIISWQALSETDMDAYFNPTKVVS